MEAGIFPFEMGVAVARVSFLPEGAGMIWNGSGPEVPPAGGGVSTVTCAVPVDATSEARIWASSRELLTKVVVRGLPFQSTTEVLVKPDPFTVIVKSGVPAGAADEESDVTMGTPLVTENVTAAEVPPPGEGLNTVTETLPTLATSEDGMDAVNWVALTKFVARLAPFQRTTELEMKEEPFTVSVNAPSPALALVGEMDVRLGTGFEGVGVPPPPPSLPQPARNNERLSAAKATGPTLASRHFLRWVLIRSAGFQPASLSRHQNGGAIRSPTGRSAAACR